MDFNLVFRSMIFVLYIIWFAHLMMMSYSAWSTGKMRIEVFGTLLIKTLLTLTLILVILQ